MCEDAEMACGLREVIELASGLVVFESDASDHISDIETADVIEDQSAVVLKQVRKIFKLVVKTVEEACGFLDNRGKFILLLLIQNKVCQQAFRLFRVAVNLHFPQQKEVERIGSLERIYEEL